MTHTEALDFLAPAGPFHGTWAWVPYPLRLARLTDVAQHAGLTGPRAVARRQSAYHREMYCAVLEPRDFSGAARPAEA